MFRLIFENSYVIIKVSKVHYLNKLILKERESFVMKNTYSDPYIRELRNKYKMNGFQVLGISVKLDGIHVKLKDKDKTAVVCPDCGKDVDYWAFSRPRTYRDVPLDNGQDVFVHVLRREMHCKCGKHFTAPKSLLPSGRRMTGDMERMVRFFKTNPNMSRKEIADGFGVSVNYVDSVN